MSLTSIIFSGHDFPSVSRGKHQVPAEKTFLWLQRAGIVEIRSTSAAISRINRAKLRTKSFLFFFFFLFIYFILFFFLFQKDCSRIFSATLCRGDRQGPFPRAALVLLRIRWNFVEMRQVAEEAREVDGLRFNGEGSCESLWNVVQEEVRLQEQLWNCLIVRGFEKNAVLCVRGCGCVCYRCSFSVPDYCLGIFCNVKRAQVSFNVIERNAKL